MRNASSASLVPKVAASSNSRPIAASETIAVAPPTTIAAPKMRRFIEPVNSRQVTSPKLVQEWMTIQRRFDGCAAISKSLVIALLKKDRDTLHVAQQHDQKPIADDRCIAGANTCTGEVARAVVALSAG